MEVSEGTIWGVRPSEVEDTLWKGVCVMAEGARDRTGNR